MCPCYEIQINNIRKLESEVLQLGVLICLGKSEPNYDVWIGNFFSLGKNQIKPIKPDVNWFRQRILNVLSASPSARTNHNNLCNLYHYYHGN